LGKAAALATRLAALELRPAALMLMKLRITIMWRWMSRPRRSRTKPREGDPGYRGLALPSGARLTPQRRALLDLIADRDGSFTAVDLFQEARRRKPKLGLATVYRTVDLLRRTGSVRPLVGDVRPAYVRCDPGHHHHLICVACGAVEETELCGAPSPSVLRRRYGFRAESHELDVYGTCVRCS
jgi:Fe2+ or Zn2+ uptake regulation protein